MFVCVCGGGGGENNIVLPFLNTLRYMEKCLGRNSTIHIIYFPYFSPVHLAKKYFKDCVLCPIFLSEPLKIKGQQTKVKDNRLSSKYFFCKFDRSLSRNEEIICN